MQEVTNRFKAVEKKLAAQAWFKKNGWIASSHGFPATKPDGVTFHVFKKHWLNGDTQGIHIESYLALDPKKRKSSYVTLHILHHALIPGTKLKRTVISQPFVDAIFDEVNSWDGYEFRAGKYGLQPFTKKLDGTSASFEADLAAEVTLLCRKLGPVMDEVLEGVGTQRGLG